MDRAIEHLQRLSQCAGDARVEERRVDIGQSQTHRARAAADRSAQESRQSSALRSREAEERELVARRTLLESGAQAASKAGKIGTTEQSLQPFGVHSHFYGSLAALSG